MSSQQSYRIRLRVHIGKALATDEIKIYSLLANHQVEIRSQNKNEILRNTKWIVLTAGGFQSFREAEDYGANLRSIIGIVGFCTRTGIDVGNDQVTSGIDENWARSIGLIKENIRLLPTVHGLSIFPDDQLSRFFRASGNATVEFDPGLFVNSIQELGKHSSIVLYTAAPAISLLNLALINTEPLAQVVLAISAVEALGQEEVWTENQKNILERLAQQVENEGNYGNEEKEVANALRVSLHRISLRQGVLRVFNRLGLGYLKKEWDLTYRARSGVFHGTKHFEGPELHKLAQSAITLCGTVIVALLQEKGVPVPTISETNYTHKK